MKSISAILICSLIVFSHCTSNQTPEGHIKFGKNNLYKLADDDKELPKDKEHIDAIKPFINTNNNIQLPVNKLITDKDSSLITFITLVHPNNASNFQEYQLADTSLIENGAFNDQFDYAILSIDDTSLLRIWFKCSGEDHLFTLNFASEEQQNIEELKNSPQEIIDRIKCASSEE